MCSKISTASIWSVMMAVKKDETRMEMIKIVE